MYLRTIVRDCLYLNWAFPLVAMPPAPGPLRYEVHRHGGEDWVFVSALLFRQAGLHLPNLPLPRLSYPQFNLRAYVLDPDGVASVLFWRMLVPAWVVPGARLVGRQGADAARFDYPEPPAFCDERGARWRVRCGGELEVSAAPGAPALGVGPRLASWETLVDTIRQRPRGYGQRGRGLARVSTSHPAVDVVPVRATLGASSLLRASAPPVGVDVWPPLHSAFLCPSIPFAFDFGLLPAVEAASPTPQPV
jgi:hypothetical protein